MLRQPFQTADAVSLWYAEGSAYCPSSLDPLAAFSPIIWHQILFTGETLSAHLTAAPSERIGRTTSEGAIVVQGEVSGEIRFEAQANTFLRNAFVCALMDDTHQIEFGRAGLARSVLMSGSTPHPLMLLKKIDNGDGLSDFYLFLGMEIDTLSFEVSSTALVTGVATLMGRSSIPYLTAAPDPPNWRFIEEYRAPLMSGYDALRDFRLGTADGSVYPTLLHDLTFSISNQLRGQYKVGGEKPFPEGIGVGRIKVTYGGRSYYTSQSMAKAMLADERLQITGRLWDSGLGSFGFLSQHVKPISHSGFIAEADDQDMLTQVELQAFLDDAGNTLSVLVGRGREVCGAMTYFQTSDGRFFLAEDGKPIATTTFCDGDTIYYMTADGQLFADENGALIKVENDVKYDMDGARYFLSNQGRILAA